MGGVIILQRPATAYTRAERDALPDDGRRHELIDGVLVVTPAPAWPHQRAVTRLLSLLDSGSPWRSSPPPPVGST